MTKEDSRMDRATFARIYQACELLYGHDVTELDIDRAFARYQKIEKRKNNNA